MKFFLVLLCFSFLSLNVSATDSDEFVENDIAVFDTHWRTVKCLLLRDSVHSWDELKSMDPDAAYHIARFWLRKADVATAEYQKLIYERIVSERPSKTDAEKKAQSVKYHGAIPEAFRCYYYDNVVKIEGMIEANIKALKSTGVVTNGSETDIKSRLDELRDLREKYQISQEAKLPKPVKDP